MPHIALASRLYVVGVEATSCKAERNFSALSLLIVNLQWSMSVFKVEQMVFLRLNQDFIPEVKEYKIVRKAQEDRRNAYKAYTWRRERP